MIQKTLMFVESKDNLIKPGDRLQIQAETEYLINRLKGASESKRAAQSPWASTERVEVKGLTTQQAESIVLRHLQEFLKNPQGVDHPRFGRNNRSSGRANS